MQTKDKIQLFSGCIQDISDRADIIEAFAKALEDGDPVEAGHTLVQAIEKLARDDLPEYAEQHWPECLGCRYLEHGPRHSWQDEGEEPQWWRCTAPSPQTQCPLVGEFFKQKKEKHDAKHDAVFL